MKKKEIILKWISLFSYFVFNSSVFLSLVISVCFKTLHNIILLVFVCMSRTCWEFLIQNHNKNKRSSEIKTYTHLFDFYWKKREKKNPYQANKNFDTKPLDWYHFMNELRPDLRITVQVKKNTQREISDIYRNLHINICPSALIPLNNLFVEFLLSWSKMCAIIIPCSLLLLFFYFFFFSLSLQISE